ncbi:MAG TPA: hypothetical protein VJR67_01935, partial [Candidatus Nitrosopolaris sp.]|nr:hypothetical protein [Candidatus Nitrosopolaris sp.]
DNICLSMQIPTRNHRNGKEVRESAFTVSELSLEMTLYAEGLTHKLELQYSDQCNRMYQE